MMNINILNKVVQGVAEQLPLVNSFYTQSPYESWNVADVRYGSVSFVVTKTNTNEQTTVYEAVLYYGDRLTENKMNKDSVHSDAATVIQTIIGALNQTDETYITIDYPVGITLFEQSFCDDLAGGYANISITVEGIGECFNDEYAIPEIIGISSYFTKEEITELFPLRTQLSTIAYSGSFRDLQDIPDLITEVQYNQLYERVSNVTRSIENLDKVKLDKTTFDETIKALGGDLSGVASKRELETFINGQNQINTNLAVELKNKVSSGYFQEEVANINTKLAGKVDKTTYDGFVTAIDVKLSNVNTSLNNKVSTETFRDAISSINTQVGNGVSKSTFDNFVNGQNLINTNLAVELGQKLDKDFFDGWKDGIMSTLETKISRQSFDIAMSNVYTKPEVDTLVTSKVDKVVGEYIKSDEVVELINTAIDDAVNDISNEVTDLIKDELDSMVEEEIQSQIGEFVTESEVDQKIADQYNNFIGTDEFKEELKTAVESSITDVVGDIVTEDELATKNYASKYYVDNKIAANKPDLTSYPTRDEVEVMVDNVTVDLTPYPTKTEIAATYPTKTYVTSNFYTKSQVDNIVNNLDVEVDLTPYPTKTEIANTYYTKTEVDDIVDSIESGTVDLSNYYTKTQVDSKDTVITNKFNNYYTKTEVDEKVKNVDLEDYYTKDEVDNIISDIEVGGDVDLSNYYKKSETYSKVEITTNFYSKSQIDSMIGDIDTILNNVLYSL